MAAECELSADLCRAFYSALLLTGSPVSAEYAVSAAIKSVSCEDLNADALLYATIDAVVRSSEHRAEQTPGSAAHDRVSLPGELRHVLHMKSSLRYCFVVRVLLGLPVEDCARLSGLRPADVKARASEAVLWLAGQAETNTSTRVSAWQETMATYSPLWR